MRRLLFIILVTFPALLPAQKKVVTIHIDGTINPAAAEFIHNSIEKAGNEKAACLLIHLNTPGGLLQSTRDIVSSIMESPVPVVVYVSPPGAHSGSAGVFITLAAHIAAMAPGTNIGAAHPVSSGAILDSVMNEKVTNDATAFIRTIAEKRNRNMEWAEAAVRKSVSITATEAKDMNVIDLIAINQHDLLNKIDGKTVEVSSGNVTLKTREATIEEYEMGWVEKILNILSDPNIAYILMLIGIYGVMFELYNPGAILPGILGGISLILAFYSMHTLPINYAGLALILFGVILFLLEIKVVSHGLLAIGGTISLMIGSAMLIKSDPSGDIVRISWSVIISSSIVTALFFLFVVGMGIKAQRAKPVTGLQAMIGEIGKSMVNLNPAGNVLVHGEIWRAESVAGEIKEGQKVKITGIENYKLLVEPFNA